MTAELPAGGSRDILSFAPPEHDLTEALHVEYAGTGELESEQLSVVLPGPAPSAESIDQASRDDGTRIAKAEVEHDGLEEVVDGRGPARDEAPADSAVDPDEVPQGSLTAVGRQSDDRPAQATPPGVARGILPADRDDHNNQRELTRRSVLLSDSKTRDETTPQPGQAVTRTGREADAESRPKVDPAAPDHTGRGHPEARAGDGNSAEPPGDPAAEQPANEESQEAQREAPLAADEPDAAGEDPPEGPGDFYEKRYGVPEPESWDDVSTLLRDESADAGGDVSLGPYLGSDFSTFTTTMITEAADYAVERRGSKWAFRLRTFDEYNAIVVRVDLGAAQKGPSIGLQHMTRSNAGDPYDSRGVLSYRATAEGVRCDESTNARGILPGLPEEPRPDISGFSHAEIMEAALNLGQKALDAINTAEASEELERQTGIIDRPVGIPEQERLMWYIVRHTQSIPPPRAIPGSFEVDL